MIGLGGSAARQPPSAAARLCVAASLPLLRPADRKYITTHTALPEVQVSGFKINIFVETR